VEIFAWREGLSAALARSYFPFTGDATRTRKSWKTVGKATFEE